MDSIENMVISLRTQISEAENEFAGKYANYEQDKKELSDTKKRIEEEIRNRLNEYQKQKEDELNAVKDEIKKLNPKSGAKRSYKKNDAVVNEVIDIVATEIKSDTGFTTRSDKQSYLLKIVNTRVDEIANYKRAKTREDISKKAVNKLIEQLSISA
jgi:DNA-directed RNA polymerase specialized sigma54-like protein